MGGKPEVKYDPQQNPDALALLREIAPGIDHGYNQDAWRRHFAAQLMASPGDLRRDL